MSIISFDFYVRGMLIGWLHLCVGFFLDITFSKDEYNELKKNKKLWTDAWKYIQINLLIITPIVYTLIIPYFISFDERFEKNKWLGLILIQNILYSCIHYILHHYLYFIHKFHHQFQNILIPSIAFAVSPMEFLFAYLLPFGVGAILTKPTEITLYSSIFFLSSLNFFIHMSKLKNIEWLYCLVSPKEHLEHHSKKTKYYSAPFLSFDKIFS